MKTATILRITTLFFTYCSLFIAHSSLSQGSIDIDTNIQMGIAGNEHVKITTTNFSIHQDAASPLIYGDFGTGNVGIGTSSPKAKLHIEGDVAFNNGYVRQLVKSFSYNDNSPSTMFNISTTNESGTNDGGGLTIKCFVSLFHAVSAGTGSGATKAIEVVFSVATDGFGNISRSSPAIVTVGNAAADDSATRSIGSLNVTLVAVNNYSTDVKITVDNTGSFASQTGSGQVIIDMVWGGYSSPPQIN